MHLYALFEIPKKPKSMYNNYLFRRVHPLGSLCSFSRRLEQVDTEKHNFKRRSRKIDEG